MNVTGTKRFAGKTAVITGAGRPKGLGEAIARRLAEEGASVVISDIGASADPSTPSHMVGLSEDMIAVRDQMAALGVSASAKACDVRNFDDVQALARHAVDTHGSLDIWVNNAGIGYLMKPILEVSETDWRAVIDVNLSGAFFGVQAAARIMIDQGRGGRIINIASIGALKPLPGLTAYCMSKAAVAMMTDPAMPDNGSHHDATALRMTLQRIQEKGR